MCPESRIILALRFPHHVETVHSFLREAAKIHITATVEASVLQTRWATIGNLITRHVAMRLVDSEFPAGRLVDSIVNSYEVELNVLSFFMLSIRPGP